MFFRVTVSNNWDQIEQEQQQGKIGNESWWTRKRNNNKYRNIMIT